MRFQSYPKALRDPASPQRFRAAERNVQAQREAMALFPDLVEDRSADERVARIIDARFESWKERRADHAQLWRKARRMVAALPDGPRRGLLRYWQHGPMPASPEYLADMVTQVLRGTCYWHKMAELRRLWLIARGRLPNPWRPASP